MLQYRLHGERLEGQPRALGIGARCFLRLGVLLLRVLWTPFGHRLGNGLERERRRPPRLPFFVEQVCEHALQQSVQLCWVLALDVAKLPRCGDAGRLGRAAVQQREEPVEARRLGAHCSEAHALRRKRKGSAAREAEVARRRAPTEATLLARRALLIQTQSLITAVTVFKIFPKDTGESTVARVGHTKTPETHGLSG